MFDQIMYKANGKQIVVFLDYDGTLSPIVADPNKAYMTKKVYILFYLDFDFDLHCFIKLKEYN